MKNKVMIVVFAVLLFIVPVYTFLSDTSILVYERRMVHTFPALMKNGRWNADFCSDLEAALNDRVPMRRWLLGIGSTIKHNVFLMQDEDGVYEENGYLFRMGTLHEENIENNVKLMNEVVSLFSGEKVFVIVPRKNTYDENRHPDYSYADVKEVVKENWNDDMLDIRGLLTISDYYHTDIHWKQECIQDVGELVLSVFGKEMAKMDVKEVSYSPFYGALSAYQPSVPADELIYCTNEVLESVAVENMEKEGERGVYDVSALSSPDPYNVFLEGPAAYLHIENKRLRDGSHLVVFRDSFASSLLPWIIPSYETVDVIDLRYYHSSLVDELSLYEDSDVLCLYSEEVLNDVRLR